jgi:hypothetical protein
MPFVGRPAARQRRKFYLNQGPFTLTIRYEAVPVLGRTDDMNIETGHTDSLLGQTIDPYHRPATRNTEGACNNRCNLTNTLTSSPSYRLSKPQPCNFTQ